MAKRKPIRKRASSPRTGRTIPVSAAITAPLLTQADLCALLRITRQTLWVLRKSPSFPLAIVLSDRGQARWTPEAIDQFIASRRADRVAG